jgi:hypothetical protein
MVWSGRRRSIGAVVRGVLIAATVIAGASGFSAPLVHAQDGDAKNILKAMSDYLADQKVITATFDSDVEVLTTELQKIQFASTGRFQLARPDKLQITRTGGYADLELVSDGKTATIFGKHLGSYAQIEAPGSIDQLIDRLRDTYLMVAPGADLLLSNVYAELIEDVVGAKHIGRGVIDGVECEHLAFRNPEVDWQLWVEVGARPIPRKYVITSKAVTGAPQYSLRLSDWKTDAHVKPDAFFFKPPATANKVEVGALAEIDEVPPGTAIGGSK